MAGSTKEGLTRNVDWYPIYQLIRNAYFRLPVFFLYFSQEMSLRDVLLVGGIYYSAVVLLEVPSGWFSDRFGRRLTMILASMSMLAAYVVFCFADGLMTFTIAQVLIALGFSFHSGTDTAFHYDSLAGLGREAEYADREARASRNSFLGGAVAAVIGGGLGVLDLRLPYIASALTTFILVVMAFCFVEPPHKKGEEKASINFLTQMRHTVSYLKIPFLSMTFLYFILMTIINHIPYEYYQPYIKFALEDFSWASRQTPFVSGLHTTGTLLVATYFAARSIRIRNAIGIWPTLLLASLLQGLIIGLMGFILSPIVVLICLGRSAPRALMTAPLNAAITGRVSKAHRATFLSFQSLAGRLSFAAVLFYLSSLSPHGREVDWPLVSMQVQVGFWIAVVGIAGLVLVCMVRRDGTGSPDEA